MYRSWCWQFESLAIAVLIGSVSGPVLAQSAPMAEALFERGRAAMAARDFDTACPSFQESYRLDPAVGALFNLAECERQRGRVATAWVHFRAVVDRLPTDDDRLTIAQRSVLELEPLVPRLTLRVRQHPLRISLDATVLGTSSFNVPLPVDPGSHAIEVAFVGNEVQRLSVSLLEGQKRELPLEPRRAERKVPIPRTTSGWSRVQTGYVVGAAGGAFLVAGGVVGGLVLADHKTVTSHCDASKSCDEEGADAARRGRALAPWSTAGLLMGIAGLSTGAYLVWSGSSTSPQTSVSASGSAEMGQIEVVHRW